MYNLLISLAAAVGAFLIVYATGLVDWWGALFPATVALVAAYFLLARRSLRQFEAIMGVAQKEIGAKRIEPGLAEIRKGFALSKWQFFIAPQVHAQLGMLLYMLKRFDEARPHLEQSFVRIGQARAMLGALYFKDKKFDKMSATFEEALKHSKKEGFVWSIYAWCLDAAGLREQALGALGRAVTENPNDEKLKNNQLALQNKERLRMKAYGPEWWAYHLEPPPADMAPPGMRMQPGFRKGYRQPPKDRQ